MVSPPAHVEHAAVLRAHAAPGREAFLEEYLRPSRPAVFTGMALEWPASRQWGFDSLRSLLHNRDLPVLSLQDHHAMVDDRHGLPTLRLNADRFFDELPNNPSHYVSSGWDALPPELRDGAPLPALCGAPRWMRRKFWVTPAGTRTPLHWDMADNLHTVLTGRKHLLMFPPRDSLWLEPYELFSGAPNLGHVNPEQPTPRQIKKLARCHPVWCEAGPGDTVFIPMGWWHFVATVENTISINTWWAEGWRLLPILAADGFKWLRGVSR